MLLLRPCQEIGFFILEVQLKPFELDYMILEDDFYSTVHILHKTIVQVLRDSDYKYLTSSATSSMSACIILHQHARASLNAHQFE